MQDDEILNLIKHETPYLADDGFTQKLMNALPQAAQYRQKVIGFSWSSALILGFVLWLSGGSGLTLFSLQPAFLLSAAALTFWAVIALFVFIANDEGILDL